jgi:DtxR family Mn-dependent transcriptional regulator
VRVSDEDGALLRYLGELALTPGTELTLVERAPFGGPLTLAVGDARPAVGPSVAEQVLVEPLEASPAPRARRGAPRRGPDGAEG